jgi:tripartite-type tricarboxylate transporter receptor subunit TctC
MKRVLKAGLILLAVAVGFGYIDSAAAETPSIKPYPTKFVRLIVPMSPGGFQDLAARLVAGHLSAALGQQVIIDNRSGAGGVVGSELAARAEPDGYTLITGSLGTHAVNQTLYAKLPFNVLRDFQPIARLAGAPGVLAVNPSFPVHSVKELIALARSKPKQINYASAGAGTSTHLAAALFEHLARVEFVHVPYKGGGPSMIAVVSGEVPMTFGTAAAVSSYVKNGKLRAIAVTGAQRSAQMPDLPTIEESGLPGYAMDNWLGLFAPARTPRGVVEKLSSEAIRVVRLPDVSAGLNALGAEPSPLGPDEFAAFVKKEVDKWAKVVVATGMTAM